MQGGSTQCLLVLGLVAVLLSLLVLTPAAAAPAQPAAHRAKHHARVPRMEPAQQKLQSLLQEPSTGRTADARPAQAGVLTALSPTCVPKYVTDLFIPPPMPVSMVPMRQKEGASPMSKEGKARLASYDDEDSEEGVKVVEYEHPSHLSSSSQQMTSAQRAKLRQSFSIDEEYYQQWASTRESERLIKTDKKKRRKQDTDEEEEEEDSDSDKQKRVAAEPPAPEEKEQDPSAEQVPPVQPVFHSYDVSVRQISQNVLPPTPTALPGCPATFALTNVLAYGPANIAGQPFHNWPGFSIEAQRNMPTHIRWTNDLKAPNGAYLPHILRDSIDQTIHWANPAALGGAIDSNPCHMCSLPTLFTCPTDPACVTAATTTYTGPVPIITHVHGQTDVPDFSDGYTEAWYLPAANNLAGFTPVGSWYNQFQAQYTAFTGGQTWTPGSNTGIYLNTQRAAQLWYHDHTLGLTRTNVFAGMAGMYFLRDKFPSIANGPELPGLPYPAYDGVIPLDLVRELPLAIQDRSFTSDSQLWYPIAAQPAASTLPNGPLHPRWLPEYAATLADPVTGVTTNYIMWTVNGRTYPRQVVYPDSYRLRILNGCNTRTVQLRFAVSSNPAINPLLTADTSNLLPFWVVGNDDGFWPALSAPMTTLEMGPAERYDVVIDFSRLAPGEFVYMLNNGPEPDTAIYDGTNNGLGLTEHTAQIMRFDVNPLPVGGISQPFTLARQEALNNALIADWAANVAPIVPPATARQVTLMENLDPSGIPLATLLGTGTNNANGLQLGTPQLWMDPVTADSPTNADSTWDIINLSADSHPIHFHHVDFEYLGRFQLLIDPLNPNAYTKTDIPVLNQDLDPLLVVPCPVTLNPTGRCPVRKDTQLILPGSYARVAFKSGGRSGLYVWHCHLVEHEDNEMMVPHCFGNVNYLNPATGAPMCPPGPNALSSGSSSGKKGHSHSKAKSKSQPSRHHHTRDD